MSVTKLVEMNTPVDATVKGAAGVYQIRNMLNGKIYIGSSVNLNKREQEHRSALNNNRHHSIHLQRAWKKYGEVNFEFETLITCHLSMCLWYEQQFLDQWEPEYNNNPVAAVPPSQRGKIHIHTEQQRKKMSLAAVGNKKNVGRIHTAVARKNMMGSNLGNKAFLGKRHSIEARSKMCLNRPNRKLTFENVREIRERISLGETLTSIAQSFGVTIQAISLIKHGKNWKHFGGTSDNTEAHQRT